MIRVAIIEDDDAYSRSLTDILTAWGAANGERFDIHAFTQAEPFLQEAKANAFDMAFLDIELPGIDGMEAAFRLRAFDKKVILFFVTNMAQYAVRGYEVGALYYIMKPVTAEGVAHKLSRAVAVWREQSGGRIVLQDAGAMVTLSTREITYVEVLNHKLHYHTKDGVYLTYGTLSDAEETLRPFHFFRCNSGYLVNAAFIRQVKGFTVVLKTGEELQISHPKKKQFMLDMADYLGGGNA